MKNADASRSSRRRKRVGRAPGPPRRRPSITQRSASRSSGASEVLVLTDRVVAAATIGRRRRPADRARRERHRHRWRKAGHGRRGQGKTSGPTPTRSLRLSALLDDRHQQRALFGGAVAENPSSPDASSQPSCCTGLTLRHLFPSRTDRTAAVRRGDRIRPGGNAEGRRRQKSSRAMSSRSAARRGSTAKMRGEVVVVGGNVELGRVLHLVTRDLAVVGGDAAARRGCAGAGPAARSQHRRDRFRRSGALARLASRIDARDSPYAGPDVDARPRGDSVRPRRAGDAARPRIRGADQPARDGRAAHRPARSASSRSCCSSRFCS